MRSAIEAFNMKVQLNMYLAIGYETGSFQDHIVTSTKQEKNVGNVRDKTRHIDLVEVPIAKQPGSQLPCARRI